MSTPSLLARRSVSVCLACRRQLLRQRQFSTTPLAAYQAYTLPSHPPVSPRNANVPGTSIAHTGPSPPPPRIHVTRPPQQPDAPPLDTSTTADPAAAPVSLPGREAQQSRPEFAATAAAVPPPSASSSSSSSSPAQPAPTTTTASTTTTSTTTTSSSPTPSPSPSTAQQAPAGGTRPRSRLLRTPRKAALRLTPAAVAHLRELLDQPGEEGGTARLVKVGVRNRGCSGLAYHLQLVHGAGALDETVEQDGVRVVIDGKALFSVIGSEMDWVEDKLSQRFVFRNPNIKEECGCGESFMV